MKTPTKLFLDEGQAQRLVDLLEQYVDDYGVREVARFVKHPMYPLSEHISCLSSITEGNLIPIDSINARYICSCLAINPGYVFNGKLPVLSN